ncbi:unnamed protein product [Phytophthora fragariaefolia]|uniref:Unnamed protein product n=1 Tax=Phytophthora fragariaefolia TaxID=1490495 RepID=A0A9W6UAJ7_9STRA|nr:unnamed protein product [Phytophthora fragariaefolia]
MTYFRQGIPDPARSSTDPVGVAWIQPFLSTGGGIQNNLDPTSNPLPDQEYGSRSSIQLEALERTKSTKTNMICGL